MKAAALANSMFTECARDEQSVRRVTNDVSAEEVRAELRRLAREGDVRIRTARLDDTVVVVRLDARVWNADQKTMRDTLTLQRDQTSR